MRDAERHHCCVEQSVPRVRSRADLHPAAIAPGVAACLEREFGAQFLSVVVERRQPEVTVKDIAPLPHSLRPFPEMYMKQQAEQVTEILADFYELVVAPPPMQRNHRQSKDQSPRPWSAPTARIAWSGRHCGVGGRMHPYVSTSPRMAVQECRGACLMRSRVGLVFLDRSCSRITFELVTATDGNHGHALARMARLLGLPARDSCQPRWTRPRCKPLPPKAPA